VHTQCPRCQTIFRINATHLNIAQGQVRCSRCRHVFNANDHLVKELPQKETVQPSMTETKPDAPTEDFTEDLLESDFPELLKEEEERGRSWKSLFFWLMVAILFIGILFSQYLWLSHRDLVLQNTQVRPWLERFCNVFLCTLPATRAVDRFEMEKHLIQKHPTVANAMQVDATFINRAEFPQPYPVLQLTFQNTEGQPIAQRRFLPMEYLQLPQITDEMRPNAAVHIRLELTLENIELSVEDNKVVKGYVFDFL
jgi:predicted Zn finger-like uncharacterized protein